MEEKTGPVTVEELLTVTKQVGELNKIMSDRYMKIVQFLEEKGLIEEYGIWHVERFEDEQDKVQN